jgi:hypothetical protein
VSIREAYEGEGRPREALEAAADVWAAVIDYWSKKKNILVRLERQEGKRLEGKSERERERENAPVAMAVRCVFMSKKSMNISTADSPAR